MYKTIIGKTTEQGKYAVITEDDKLTEIYCGADSSGTINNIYLGRIETINKKTGSIFINIGTDKNAFTTIDDVNRGRSDIMSEELKDGRMLLVQSTVEASGNKGTRVSTEIRIPGTYLVLCPNSSGIGISCKIPKSNTAELHEILSKIKPVDCGVIARTTALGRTAEELKADLDRLTVKKKLLEHEYNRGGAPRLVLQEADIFEQLLRYIPSDEYVKYIIDDRYIYDRLLNDVSQRYPEYADKLRFYDDSKYDIYEFYNIKSQLRHSFGRQIYLKCGGWIVIEHTEALTVIDVNSGKFTGVSDQEQTAYITNVEAMREIVVQLRIHSIGGIIIIDAINMKNSENKKKLLDILSDELKNDNRRSSAPQITSLGLIEFTREKTQEIKRQDIAELID